MNRLARRRVLFPFVGDSLGGSTFSALTLIEHLDKARFEVSVVVHEVGPIAEELRRRSLAYDVLSLPGYAGTTPQVGSIALACWRALPTLRHFLKEQHIDLVHTNDLRMHLTWTPATRLSGVGHVWHCRQLLGGSPLWSLLGATADRVIAVSPEVAATLPRTARSKALIVPNPVPESGQERETARAALAAEIGMPADASLVGFVGNLMKQKRPTVFVEAAGQVRAKAYFVVAGDDRGGERASVESIAKRLGLGSRLHILGYRNPVEPVIAALDVLVAPGVGDSFGRTLVEAMMAGTPVVASDSGGHRSIVASGETGLLVPPDDPAATADAVMRLLGDFVFARGLAVAAQREARQRYAPAAIASAVGALYDEIP